MRSTILLILLLGGALGNDPSDPNLSNSTNPSDLHGNLTRARRNADPLSEYSHKLSTVARISNGISLLAGLINGNIPVDSVIQELLNFGDVKVQDVLALDKNKVDTALNELEGATEGFKLEKNSKLPLLESQTLALHQIREVYKSIGDFAAYKVPTTYFNEVKKFKDDSTDLGLFAALLVSINKTLESIDKLEKTGTVDDNNYLGVAQEIKNVRLNLQSVLDAPTKFQLIVSAVDGFEGLRKPEETFKTLINMLDVLRIQESIQYSNTASAELIANMDKIKALSTSLNPSKSDVVRIEDLVNSMENNVFTKRQYTSGFVKGASDLKLLTSDIRDPSVEQTIGTGKNFARLSGGLKPLETLSSKLDPVETKLKTISKSVIPSTSAALRLHSLISNLAVDSNLITATLQDLAGTQFVSVKSGLRNPVNEVVKNAKLLALQLQSMKSLAQNLPPSTPEVTEVHRLVDLKSGAVHTDVQRLIESLKSAKDNVDKVKEYLQGLKSELRNAPNGQDIKSMADTVFTEKKEIDDFLKETSVTGATGKLNQLKNITGPVEEIAKIVQASQIIRSFKKDDITNIKSAVDTISQASGLIKDIQNVPNTMKTNKAAEVKELVAMNKSTETAATLGFAAGSIRSMDGLRGLEASVNALKNDQLFDAEVKKLTDPKKSDILQKYGDHKAFVAALEASISQINTFKSKLAAQTDLTKLGTPLTDAKSVSSVPGSIQEKSEAIGMLISEVTDPQTKTNLKALKDHMDQLGALDLNFASGHTAFSQAPAALQGLFTFLTTYLSPQTAVTPSSSGSNAPKESSAGLMMYLFIGIGVLVLAIIVGAVIFGVLRAKSAREKRMRDSKKPWSEIKKWFETAFFLDMENSLATARTNTNEMNRDISNQKFKKTEDKKMRNKDQKVFAATAVSLPDGRFINANWMKTCEGLRFIATQGPLENGGGKIDTRADFLYMAISLQSEYIVQLCKFEEDAKYEGTEKKSARYFADKPGDQEKIFPENDNKKHRYTVTTTAVRYEFEKGIEKRDLTIFDEKTKKEHKLTHLHLLLWAEYEIPGRVEEVVRMLEIVNKSKKPVIVHCGEGVGRTVSFIGAEIIARDIERHPNKSTSEPFYLLGQMRYKGITSAAHAAFTVQCAHRLLINQYCPEDAKYIKEVFDLHVTVYYQVAAQLMEDEKSRKDFTRKSLRIEDEWKEWLDGPDDDSESTKKPVVKPETPVIKTNLAELPVHTPQMEKEPKESKKEEKDSKTTEKESKKSSNKSSKKQKDPKDQKNSIVEKDPKDPKDRKTGGADRVVIEMD